MFLKEVDKIETEMMLGLCALLGKFRKGTDNGSEISSRQNLVIHVLTGETGNLNALGAK